MNPWLITSSLNANCGMLVCLEGADETSYQKAENHLLETGGIPVSARQIQRRVQRVGAAAQAWQERAAQPGGNAPAPPVSRPSKRNWANFVHNVERMQYGTFRRQGCFIGSGVIEAGCKTVIGARCRQSGMFWGEPGAEHVLALRCLHSSRRLAEFWKDRLNAHAARNDRLPLAA